MHEYVGVNSRLDTLQAAILGVKLTRLEEWNRMRRTVAAKYDAALGEFAGLTLPAEMPGGKHVYHLYVVRIDRRDELRQYLSENGIGVGIHYPIPLHLQPALQSLGYGPGDFPVAEQLADSILSDSDVPGNARRAVSPGRSDPRCIQCIAGPRLETAIACSPGKK